MIEILRDPIWQGVGAIAGIVGIFVAIWLARNPTVKGKPTRNAWRLIGAILSILLPVYANFAFSIIIVNAFTSEAKTLVYWSVAIASAFGSIWGIVWATYIQKAFTISTSPRRASKTKDKEK